MISDKTHLLYSDTCGMFSRDRGHQDISLFLFSLCQRRGAARNCFTASSDSLFHPPLSLVFFFRSSSSPAFLTSIYQSPPISALASFVSSCPAHVTLPLSSVVCHPPPFLRVQPTVICSSPVSLSSYSVSSLNSTIIRLSALVTLAIFHTQLFSHTCSLCCCSSVSVKVSVPYRHAGVIQVLMILHFSLFEICRTAITPQLLSTRSLRPVLFDVPLSLSSRLRTLPLLGTRNCPVESVSSPPAR